MISASPRQKWLLAAVLLLAFGLRVWGIDFGLPYGYHNDEMSMVRRALAFGLGDLNPHSFHWPSFHLYVLFGFYGVLYLLGAALGIFQSTADFARLYFTDPTIFYLLGRLLNASLATATVYLAYRIAARIENPTAGLFASACLAVTYYHVWDSHLSTLDVPATFWSTLCLAFAVGIFRAPAPGRPAYVLAGAVAGLAAATKYNAGIIFLAVVAAHGLRRPRPAFALLLTAAGAAALTFLATNPFILLDGSAFLRDFAFQQIHLAEGPWGLSTELAWRYYLDDFLQFQVKDSALVLFDPMGPLLAVGFAGALLARRDRAAILLALVPVVYLVYIGRWGMAASRYLDPILPILAILTGLWVSRLPRAGRIPVLLALLLSLRAVVIADIVRSIADTRTEASAWIEREIPANSSIAFESYGPQIAPSAATIDRATAALRTGTVHHPTQSPQRMGLYYALMKENLPPVTYDLVLLNDTLLDAEDSERNRVPQTNYDIARLRSLGVEYVVVNSFQYRRFLDPRARDLYPKRAGFYDLLESDFALVKEFMPTPYQPGPVIRIYSLGEPS